MWWCLIPILILSAMALISYQSGKELKEDIKRKDKLTKKYKIQTK
ncbi:hypothetical protein ES705_09549 [subsurface metagenome]